MSDLYSLKNTYTRDPTRHTIINAGMVCILRNGFEKTRMVDVAREAGLSRTTLYKHYKTLPDIARDAMIMQVLELSDKYYRTVDSITNVEEQVVEAVISALKVLDEFPFIRKTTELLVSNPSSQSIFPEDTFYEIYSVIFEPIFSQNPHLKANRKDLTWFLLRTVASFIALPGETIKNPTVLKRYLRNTLVPAFTTKSA